MWMVWVRSFSSSTTRQFKFKASELNRNLDFLIEGWREHISRQRSSSCNRIRIEEIVRPTLAVATIQSAALKRPKYRMIVFHSKWYLILSIARPISHISLTRNYAIQNENKHFATEIVLTAPYFVALFGGRRRRRRRKQIGDIEIVYRSACMCASMCIAVGAVMSLLLVL